MFHYIHQLIHKCVGVQFGEELIVYHEFIRAVFAETSCLLQGKKTTLREPWEWKVKQWGERNVESCRISDSNLWVCQHLNEKEQWAGKVGEVDFVND